MPKLFTSIKLQLLRFKRKKRFFGQNFNWRMLILPGLVLLGSSLIALAIFWISKLPPRAPSFKKSSSEIYSYEAKNKNFQTSLGLKDQSPIISFGTSENHLITLLYQTDQQTDPQLNASGKNLTYTEIEVGVDLKYQTLANGIKEEIILNQARQKEANTGVFLFDANLQGAYLKESVKGLATPIFYDENDNYLFHFEKPFAIDAAGNRTDNVSLQIEDKANSKIPSVRRDTNGETPYLVRLTVDENWLNDPARVYPITIDPTIVHDESSEFSSGQLNRVKDTGSGSSPVLESYYQELAADEYTAGLWHMNEASGNVFDSSGNSNTGIPTGTTVVAGLLNNARSFNESGNQIVAQLASTASTNVSMEMWIKLKSPPTTTAVRLFYNGASGSNGYGIYIGNGACGAGNNINVLFGGISCNATSSTYALPLNRWTHVALTRDATTWTLYINGVANSTSTSSPPTPTTNTFIGGYDTGADFTIDEVRISNIARSPEEIKTAASRRPYSTYTSDVIDLTDAKIWNDLSWLTNGVATGDGETATASAQSALVAQWNFNETSGTTAASGGSCGASCNGTLTNFASTASQDQAIGTGWTANNKHWGVGALMFDGVNDYVSIPNNSSFNFDYDDDFSIGMWLKTGFQNTTTYTENDILFKYDAAVSRYPFRVVYLNQTGSNNGKVVFVRWDGTNAPSLTSNPINDGKYHYLAFTKEGSVLNLYQDGKIVSTITDTTASTTTNTSALCIGTRCGTSAYSFTGNIDSTRIYSRALTASEILSNYNSSNIELQTRVGATADANDGTWETWKPITPETQLLSFDSDIANWGIGSNTNPTGGVIQFTSTNVAATNAYTYWKTLSGNSLVVATNDTLEYDVYLGTNYPNTGTIDAKFTDTTYLRSYVGCHGGDLTGSAYKKWYHRVCTIPSGANGKTLDYIDLVNENDTAATTTAYYDNIVIKNSSGVVRTVLYSSGSPNFNVLDLSSNASNVGNAIVTTTNLSSLTLSNETTTKIEGTGSLKIKSGTPQVDGNTVGLWHLDETSGTGAYLKDTSAGTPSPLATGGTITYSGNYVIHTFTSSGTFTPSTSLNVEVLVVAGGGGGGGGLYHGGGGGAGGLVYNSAFAVTAGAKTVTVGDGGAGGINTARGTNGSDSVFSTITATGGGGGSNYSTGGGLNGGSGGGATYAYNTPGTGVDGQGYRGGYGVNNGTNNASGGGGGAGAVGNDGNSSAGGAGGVGVISSISGSSVYYAGGGGGSAYNGTGGAGGLGGGGAGSSGNGTSGTANTGGGGGGAERLGTTGGAGGSGIVIIRYPAATVYNDGTPTGTTTTNGISGKARSFSGSSYITIPDSNSLDLTGDFTISGWVMRTTGANGTLVSKTVGTTTGGYSVLWGTQGEVYCRTNNGTTYTDSYTSTGVLTSSTGWTYITAVKNGTSCRIYINGIDRTSTAHSHTNPVANALPLLIGARTDLGAEFTIGQIDEVSISNIVRSPEEIAEAYRMGRDHRISRTISSTNLSSISKLPFYVAADRPGTYLEAVVGESPFANYEPDASTVGLWHLDDAEYKDISTNNNHGTTSYYGIEYGVQSSNLTFVLNQWNGAANSGEIDITCAGGDAACAFVTKDGRTISTPSINYGVATMESGTATSYIMYSPSLTAQGITPYTNGSNNYISVQYTSGAWKYDNNSAWVAFTPTSSNILIASFTTGTTLSNLLQLTIHLSPTQGKIGQARSFDGSSDHVSMPDIAVPQNLTIQGWFKTTNAASIGSIASHGTTFSSTDIDWNLYLNAAGLVVFDVYRFTTASGTDVASTTAYNDGNWHYVTGVISGTNAYLYIDGVLQASQTVASYVANTKLFQVGTRPGLAGYFFNGSLDEIRYDDVARSADEIRQAYEVGSRSHQITIDFGAKLDAGNLIADINDKSFMVDATYYGLNSKGSNLYLGDKIIIKENVDGTEYIAQGTVNALTTSTGATTVSAWDSGSTFPTGGFTANSSVFKWQREYFDITGSLATQRDAITDLTFRLTNGNEGRTIWIDDLESTTGYLNDPLGSTITSSIGNRYFQYRAILSSNDSNVSASFSNVSLDYVSDIPPGIPTLDSPLDTVSGQSLLPILKTTATDTGSSYLRYKIELCTNELMTIACQTFTQGATYPQTGWTGQDAALSGSNYLAYASETQATYTLQTALEPNTIYYWRSYAIDPIGSNTWGETQTNPYSFTTSVGPSAPTDLYTENVINPAGIADVTPEFSAVHHDSDGNSAVYYEIEVNTAADFTGTVMWDSGQQSMTSTADGARSPQISYAGTVLPLNGTTYYWRIRFWDNLTAMGTWSVVQTFTMNAPPSIPTLDAPTNTAANQNFQIALQTTATDTDNNYLRYKIELCTNELMTIACQTFTQGATYPQTGWTGQDAALSAGHYLAYAPGTQATYTLQTALEPNTIYYWRSYAIDPIGSNTWGETQTNPYSFTTLTTPLAASNCYIQENIDRTQFLLVWTDNATNEDFYEVQRSVDGGTWTALQTGLAPNTINLLDTSITSGHTYQYRVAPYFTGPYYASWCTASTLNLGVGLFNLEGINASGLHFN